MINGQVSHWMRSRGTATSVALPEGPVDLAIVGAGLTGLWTAYYASRRHPQADIVIIEAEHVGYGASGRNGGWLSPLLPGNRARYARVAGPEAVVRFQREMFEGIDETLRVARQEGIDLDDARSGILQVATTPAGVGRLGALREAHLRFGYRPEEVTELDAASVRSRVAVDGALSGLVVARAAAIDPGALVTGLAAACRRRGVRIVEGVRAERISPGEVVTDQGVLPARTVVCCTEAYSGPLLGSRRLIPVNSSIIATEALDEARWRSIGWDGRELLGDVAHMFVYAQRTADGRILIGGRGSPYRYGSGLPGEGRVDPATIERLRQRLREFFPGPELPVAHAWRGVIGVTRDWCATVAYRPDLGVGSVHGFAGHGVTATNVAARTLLDRIDGRESALTTLPWNDHRSRSWEPEPLRWLGVHGMYRLFSVADRWERRHPSPRTPLAARVGSRLAGLHE